MFDAAFKSDFIEGQTQEYRLEDTSGDAIRLLVDWFYTQTIDTTFDLTKLRESDPLEAQALGRAECLALTALWVLAEKLLIPRLQNMRVDRLEGYRKATELVPTNSIVYVYQNTAQESPLRRFLVYACAGHLDPEAYKGIPERFPQEMLIDLVTLMANNTDREKQRVLRPASDMTRFYVHDPQQ